MPTFHQPTASALRDVRVLVVEDARQVAIALKSALEELGMSVIGPASTTAEARRLIAEHHPHVAVVDVNLKFETASDLIDELHEQGTPAIVTSGYAVPTVAPEKAVAFLQKPFSGSELITALRKAVDALS